MKNLLDNNESAMIEINERERRQSGFSVEKLFAVLLATSDSHPLIEWWDEAILIASLLIILNQKIFFFSQIAVCSSAFANGVHSKI